MDGKGRTIVDDSTPQQRGKSDARILYQSYWKAEISDFPKCTFRVLH